jgi:toxin YoeB
MIRKIVFEPHAFDDFNEWSILDKKLYKKIVELIQDIDRSPFSGLGKPEPLKYELSGFWSRRINDEHRLVYSVTDTEIIVIACKYHYDE